jgi:hypothetical protein
MFFVPYLLALRPVASQRQGVYGCMRPSAPKDVVLTSDTTLNHSNPSYHVYSIFFPLHFFSTRFYFSIWYFPLLLILSQGSLDLPRPPMWLPLGEVKSRTPAAGARINYLLLTRDALSNLGIIVA